MTSARTRLLALLGHPVSHSRSPEMMTRALAALCLDAVYLAFDVGEDQLGGAVNGLFALGCAGANVTVPYKRAVLAHCESVEPLARAIGAANVLVRGTRGMRAYNTDAPAAVTALREAGADLAGARAVVLGAGGAARAVAAGLAGAGMREVTVAARRFEQAAEVVRDLAMVPGDGASAMRAVGLDDRGAMQRALRDAAVVVQATTAGMSRGHGRDLAPSERLVEDTAEWVARGCTAMELVYAPRETPWLVRARARGARGIDGLEMLAHQGALGLELWFDVRGQGRLLRRLLDESEAGE